MKFFPFSALWYVKGSWNIQSMKLSEIKYKEARKRIFFFSLQIDLKFSIRKQMWIASRVLIIMKDGVVS